MKNKCIKFLIMSSCFSLAWFSSSEQFVTLDGRQFKDGNGENFSPIVCNYVVDIVTPDGSPNDFLNSVLSPYQKYGVDEFYECDGTTQDCNAWLLEDFNEILALGFNTIRLMGTAPKYYDKGSQVTWWGNCTWTCPSKGFYIQPFNYPLSDCHNNIFFPLTDPNDPLKEIQGKIFEHIRNIIEVASQAEYNGKKLKVILITGRGGGNYDTAFTDTYKNYLIDLMQYLNVNLTQAEQEAIMAYDLFNEPGTCWYWKSLWPFTEIPTKLDVCNAFSLWYQTIKSLDPNHLITMGGHGDKDVLNFDPAILSLDFYSIHFYPEKIPIDPPETYNDVINRIKGRYHWYQNNLSLPWIIGETGFRANNQSTSIKDIDGSETEQYQYADATANSVWKCNGSGYSWWTYQDEGSPTVAKSPLFGILRRGNCETPCDSLKKPVAQVFETFVVPTPTCDCVKPENYYDPYNHEVFNPSPGTNWVTGYVFDENGKPIEDVYVVGNTCIYDYNFNGEHQYLYNLHHTYTKEDGSFTIIPYDWDSVHLPNYNTILTLIISAPACSRQYFDGYEPDEGVPSSAVSNVILQKVNTGYDEAIDWDIYPGPQQIFQSSNILTFNNVNIYSAANCEGVARNEINLSPFFQAFSGSEVWLHTNPILFPCQELLDFPEKSNDFIETRLAAKNREPSVIELTFSQIKDYLELFIYPNPGEGVFTINFNTSISLSRITLSVYNQYGQELLMMTPRTNSISLNLSRYEKGVYIIQVQDAENYIIKKIVLI
jgi:hypothetical protein